MDTETPFELEEMSIDEMQKAMERGEQSARSIVELYLERIGAFDRAGPRTAAVIETNPDALEIADALDRERREQGKRGPLHGIPILIKDNIGTADRMMTTAGSLALTGTRSSEDAGLIERLRREGAILLGKTNLSEWANIRSLRSTSGWSARGGLTRNPYALDRNTSGSSSGSAASVSANFCAAAIGTETDGSIVSPSSCCGIVGIKPTVGLVSRSGVVPVAHSQDTAGPMARTVRDAATLLSAITGADARDPLTQAAGRRAEGDYTRFLKRDGLAGARIGVVRSYFGYHHAVDGIAEEAMGLMREAGAILIDPVELRSIDSLDEPELTLLQYELKNDMDAYLSGRGLSVSVHSLADVIRFNEAHPDIEMPYFGQDFFLEAVKRGALTDSTYQKAQAECRRLSRTEGIDAAMDRHGLDALFAPTGAPAWLTDLVDGDHYLGGSAQAAAVAGYPSITVPAGHTFGLPVGISFFGRAWSEALLIRIAFAFEQSGNARTLPRFRPTAIEGPA